MPSRHQVSEVASLIADPSRAAMLRALGDGRALPAGVLAREAGISPATASSHLTKLRASGLVRQQIVGRHRYFRLGGPQVADALEAIERLIPPPSSGGAVMATALSPPARAFRRARFCYDHLAGVLGVNLTQALVARRALALDGTGGLSLGPRASLELARLEIDLGSLRGGPRPLVRTCIDWTERREHLSGALGAAIAAELLERGWIARERGSRAVRVTTRGRTGLVDLGVALD